MCLLWTESAGPASVADLRFPTRRRGTSRTGSVVDGGGAQQRIGADARADGAGAGTGLWVEVEPERRVPGLGTTGESGGAHLPATEERAAAEPRGMDGRHRLESGRPPAESAGFVERAGHRVRD